MLNILVIIVNLVIYNFSYLYNMRRKLSISVIIFFSAFMLNVSAMAFQQCYDRREDDKGGDTPHTRKRSYLNEREKKILRIPHNSVGIAEETKRSQVLKGHPDQKLNNESVSRVQLVSEFQCQKKYREINGKDNGNDDMRKRMKLR